MFFAEMCACGLVALKRVDTHQLGEFQEIGNASRAFQGLVEVIAVPRHSYLVPELFSQLGNFCKRFTQSLFVTRHSAFVPEKQSKLSMERIDCTSAVDAEEFLNPGANILIDCSELFRIR